jgi:hypothetical protein
LIALNASLGSRGDRDILVQSLQKVETVAELTTSLLDLVDPLEKLKIIPTHDITLTEGGGGDPRSPYLPKARTASLNTVGCSLLNSAWGTLKYTQVVSVRSVAFSHQIVAARSLKATSMFSCPFVSMT